MDIKLVPVQAIKPYEKNPRKNDAAVEKVAASIQEFGFRVPVVLDKNNEIVAGHTRYKAAIKIGLNEIPCLIADDLTEEQIKAYRLVDNKTQELSSWDFSLLMDELTAIDALDMSEFGFAKREEDEEDHSAAGARTSNLDEGYELDVSGFDEEEFECKCPECGFRFNE